MAAPKWPPRTLSHLPMQVAERNTRCRSRGSYAAQTNKARYLLLSWPAHARAIWFSLSRSPSPSGTAWSQPRGVFSLSLLSPAALLSVLPHSLPLRSLRRVQPLQRSCVGGGGAEARQARLSDTDLSSASDADAFTIRNLATELTLKIIQHGPTHHKTPTTHTWIDLILTDENDEVLEFENNCLPSFGKHAIIDVTLNYYVPEPVGHTFSYRDYKSICPKALNDMLACCDWASMNSLESDLEGALDSLNSNLNHAINILAPLKTVN